MRFRSYLLSSTALRRPDDELGAGDGMPEDERVLVDQEDDELSLDPVEGEEGEEDDDDAAGDEDGADVDGAPEPQPRRGARDHAALRADRRRLADENALLTRQLDELRRSPAPQQPRFEETPEQEAARLAVMSPEERINYTVDKSLRRHEAQSQQLANQLMDQTDRVSFEAQAQANPIARKLAPEVERRLADLRSKGQNLPRQVVLTYLVGERLLAQQGKKKPQAQQRLARERAAPVRARGDVVPDRRRRDGDLSSLERRLENVQI